AQPLWRDKEELQVAVQLIDTGLPRALTVPAGMNAGNRKTACRELGGLVFHQRDQRADDQGCPAARYGGQLVAERLSRAGGHDQQDVPSGDCSLTDLFLV